MIELHYDRAYDAAQGRLVAEAGHDVLIITPNELTANGLRHEFTQAGKSATGVVLSFNGFLDRLVRQSPSWSGIASNNISRAIFRNVMESDPGAFSYLIGEAAVPRVSQGMISRIMAAVDVVATQTEVAEGESTRFTSGRTRQLQLLADRFEERLTSAGLSREKHAVWQGIIDLTAEWWQNLFPIARRVVFTGFDSYPDEVYLAIAAVSKQVELVQILLDFDPEDDNQGLSGAGAAMPRLCDMATKQIGPEADNDDGELVSGKRVSKPKLIQCTTVSAEIDQASRVVAHLHADGADVPDRSLIVIAVGNAATYGGRLEKALKAHGLRWAWVKPESMNRCSEVLFLERLRACASFGVTGKAVSDLLRSPGANLLVESDLTVAEAWDLASRLDYLLAFTGLLTGWKSIVHRVERAISNLHSQRQRISQWTEDEKALDDRLLMILKEIAEKLKAFSTKNSVAHWASVTAELLSRFHAVCDTPVESQLHLQGVLAEMGECGEAVSPVAVSYPYFISLFRTAFHAVNIEPTGAELFGDARPDVVLCEPAQAAFLSGGHCIVLGFNDGNFPNFARVDLSFFDFDQHQDQRPTRARQWHLLQRLLKQYGRLQLWMPERQGTEELLPSQFSEILLEQNAVLATTGDALLHDLNIAEGSPRELAEKQFVQNMRGLQLGEDELGRFERYGQSVASGARGLTVLAARSHSRLSVYDGILTDTRLKNWLSDWMARHTFSVSQLDGIVGCSFRFFADRMLNLDEIDESDGLLPAHVFGSFAHDVLARFYRGWVAAGRKALRSMDEGLAREELLRAYHAEYDPDNDLTEFARDLMTLKLFGNLGPDGFGQASLPLAEAGDVGILGQFLLLEMRRGDDQVMDFLHPANFEVGFGVKLSEEEDPLSTADYVIMDIGGGNSIKLWGRLDRIDVSDTGVFAVTDYKTGHLPTGTQIANGFRTQLPVYMLVAQQLLSKHYEQPQAAGGLYYSLKRGKGARISGAFVRAAFQAQLGVPNLRGMSDERFEETLSMVRGRIDHSMKALQRGYLTTTHHDPDTVCRYCELQKLCYRNVERTAAFWEAVEAEERGARAE